MDLRISKKTAKATRKVIASFISFMIMQSETDIVAIDQKTLDSFGLTLNDINEIVKLSLALSKQLKNE